MLSDSRPGKGSARRRNPKLSQSGKTVGRANMHGYELTSFIRNATVLGSHND